MKNDKYKMILGCFGIGCVCVMETVALVMKVDGTLLAGAVGAVCTIIGLCFGVALSKKQ
jgi:uncharacterized membrane protein